MKCENRIPYLNFLLRNLSALPHKIGEQMKQTLHRIFPRGFPPILLNVAVATYVIFALNSLFWQHLLEILSDDTFALIGLLSAFWMLTILIVELLAPGPLQRPMLAILIILSAAANYYGKTFGARIDQEMVRTIFATTLTESRHLLTLNLVIQITLTGLIPALIVWKTPTRQRRILHQLWRWPVGITASLGLMLTILYSDYQTYSSVIREHRELTVSYQPGATLSAMFKVLRQEFRADTGPIKTVAADVHRGSQMEASGKPVLMILFVGETVRSKNFGLSLEAPKTTPNLVGHDLVYLPNTESCGTLTAVSVPCMFSPLSSGEYTRSAFRGSENLTDVVARAGFNVHWWDNNTGDQNIMRSRDWKKVDRLWDPDVCYTGECTDAIFLPLIRETLDTIEEDTLLILHMIGSHGPAYHLRYMPQRAIFKPTCDTAEFSNCTTKEIVNSYNNSIVETDYVLSETIKLMSASKKADTAMIYVSDHGESLGEGGLYLHGAPKFLAPEEQTKVPFLIWLGRSYQERLGVSHDCLRNYADGPTSHDMLFHSVLGLLDLETVDLRPDLNLTSNCAVKGSVNGA